MRQAWRSSRYSPDQLRSYVMRLRRKMEPLQLPFAIISRQGSGYRFVLEFNLIAGASALGRRDRVLGGDDGDAPRDHSGGGWLRRASRWLLLESTGS